MSYHSELTTNYVPELEYYHPTMISVEMKSMAGRFGIDQPQPLSKLPCHFELLLAADFPDSYHFDELFLATQNNARPGQLQKAKLVGNQLELQPEGVPFTNNVDSRKPFGPLNTRNPQAWAPTLVQHQNTWELFFSANLLKQSHSKYDLQMGIVRAITKDLSQPFTIINLLVQGDGYLAIDQEIFNDGVQDWMYWGSMRGPIWAAPLSPSHQQLAQRAQVVLRPRPDKIGYELIEAPIRLDARGESFLFVSAADCFGQDPSCGRQYQIVQTRYDSHRQEFCYPDEYANMCGDYNVVLGTTPWFANAGHPTIYREVGDDELHATMVFSAVPWYRDKIEQTLDPTADSTLR